MDLERSGPIPMYFQVSQRLERAILGGDLPAGSRLENEVALAERLGLSRPTIRRAIQELVDKGLLVRRRGISAEFTLLDFGSVAPLFAPPSRAGTASYIAPERFTGAPHSERTEIYGIGVTLFESATRAYPYGEIERFQNPRFTAAARPARLNPALPDWLEAVLLRSVAADPAQRYQNYSQLTYDLEHPDKVEPFFAPGETVAMR